MPSVSRQDFWIKAYERSVKPGWFSSLSSIAYDKENHFLAIAGGGGMIHLLNLSSLECVDLSRLNAGIRCLTYSNGGSLVVGLDNGDVLSISADGNHSLHAKISRKAITALEYINNRLIVASEDRQLRSLDLVTFQVTQVSDKQSWAANGLAFDKETQHLLAAGSDNKLHLIDANSLKSSQVLDESSAKKNLASSNHGFIAVADCHGEVSVLNSPNYIETIRTFASQYI